MDTAIKAEWYDLEDADREGFLAWLHGRHLPALQARPGPIWIGHYNRAPKSDKPLPPGLDAARPYGMVLRHDGNGAFTVD